MAITERISNPERIMRIVDVDKLIEKVKGLRNFKQYLKESSQKLTVKDLTMGKRLGMQWF